MNDMDDYASLSIVLASKSAIRAHLMAQAGVRFSVAASAAGVEEAAKQRFHASAEGSRLGSARALACHLATAKALSVARSRPDHLVIGVDQTLELDGEILDKAADRNAALVDLQRLQGRCHHLHSAFACVRGSTLIKTGDDRAALTMHPLDASSCRAYLDHVGDSVLGSVGVYQLEGYGVRLFRAIRGDYFTILGLPLLPLLSFFADYSARGGKSL